MQDQVERLSRAVTAALTMLPAESAQAVKLVLADQLRALGTGA